MAINEGDLARYIERTEKRISALEQDLRRITKNEGHYQATSALYPLSTNLSNIREMLLLEIIREAGLLERVDLESIYAKVRAQLVDASSIPFAKPHAPGTKTAQQLAAQNLDNAIAEIQDIYNRDEDDVSATSDGAT